MGSNHRLKEERSNNCSVERDLPEYLDEAKIYLLKTQDLFPDVRIVGPEITSAFLKTIPCLSLPLHVLSCLTS